jgi:hypothetical protein
MASHDPDGAHRHRWIGLDFFVADDRPMMRQSCPCGASRTIQAWDVTWAPAGTTIAPSSSRNSAMHEAADSP